MSIGLKVFVLSVTFCACIVPLQAQFGQQLQYFPQVAAGGGAVTDFSIHNPGGNPASVRLEFISSAGVTIHSSTISLPPRATETVSLGIGQQTLQVGWGRLTALAGEFTAAAFFQITVGQQALPRVGVLPAIPTSALRFFAFVTSGETDTGIAVANPSEVTSANLVVRLIGKDGLPMLTGNTSLAPRQHVARFLTESPWFPGLNNFEGVVEIESTQAVVLLMLRSDHFMLSAAPVISPSLAGIAAGSITRDYLADGAVSNEKLADGAVSKGKLAATGGAPGQLLSLDANGLVWRDLLPYVGVSLTPAGTDVFAVGNLGGGRAMSAAALWDTALLASSGTGPGVEGRSVANDGVVGRTDAAGKSGVYGVSAAGIGVTGSSTQNDGVVGKTQASEKSGVWGNSVSGYGVTGTSSQQHGVVGMTSSAGKSGVYGWSDPGVGVTGMSPTQDGVVGATNAAEKSGVYGWSNPGVGVTGTSSTQEGVVGTTAAATKSGVYGWSAPGFGVAGRSWENHGVAGFSLSQDPSHAGVYGQNARGGPAVMADGNLHVTGAFTGNIGPSQGAPFPRPAWDSGWVPIASCEWKTLTHGLGGNADDYVVHMESNSPWGIGHHLYGDKDAGFSWLNLTNSTIGIRRQCDSTDITGLRVRIWICR